MNEITKENKIKQTLAFELDNGKTDYIEFIGLLKKFFEKKMGSEIEGTIERIDITTYSCSLDIKIVTVKEDKLKLIAVK